MNTQTEWPPWLQYIGGDTTLKPRALRVLDKVGRERALIERFRWLITYYGTVETERLAAAWIDPTKGEEPWGPALALFRSEPYSFPYYRAVHSYFLEREYSGKVLIVGPTLGGEVEAVAEAGAYPVILEELQPHLDVCESRLLSDRTVFDTIPLAEAMASQEFLYVVLTPTLEDEVAVDFVESLHDGVMACGGVVSPLSLCETRYKMESLGMVDTPVSGCSVFLKKYAGKETA